MRIECFDVSNLGGTHTTASMVVFEGGAPAQVRLPALHDPHRRGLRRLRRHRARSWAVAWPRFESQHDLSPHDPERDRSFAALPNLIVIDGGPGQLSSGLRGAEPASASAASSWSRWPSASRSCSCPGRRAPLRLDHDTPELQLLQRVRDEAHRFAITHHRIRRDRAMTASVLDDLPGRRARPQARAAGPLRLARRGARRATREELEAAPGIPGKVARDLYAAVNKTGR